MPRPKPIKARGLQCRVDFDHRVVSLQFWDNADAKDPIADIWLSSSAIFDLQEKIEEMVRINPEMLTWKKDHRPH